MAVHHKAYLEITNKCNLACAFCPGTERKPGMLDEAQFTTLVDRLVPWTEYLYYHLMGEPLSHPLLGRFIGIASERGLKSIITTNGTQVRSRGETLIAAKPHKVSISLHAFEANPPGMSFENYIGGCLDFAKAAADAGIYIALRLWNLDGRAEGALHEKNDEILEMLHEAFPGEWKKHRSGMGAADRIYLEYGEKFDWPMLDGPEYAGKGFCYGLRDQIGILCDGTVVPCCLDRNGDLALGNLFETPLADILASPRARAIYDGFSRRECVETLCRRCMRATYFG